MEHYSGREYHVVLVSNTPSMDFRKYPIYVSYKGENGLTWTKELGNFLETMSPITLKEIIIDNGVLKPFIGKR